MADPTIEEDLAYLRRAVNAAIFGIPLIEADRAAVSLCAKRDLLEEIRRSAAALDDTGLTFTPAQAIVAAVCQADTKYGPPAKEKSDGPTPTVLSSPKDQ